VQELRASLDREVNHLNDELITRFPGEFVLLDPALPNEFHLLQKDGKLLFVELESVEPYLDGVRVALKIGNPLSASFVGFVVSARWEKRRDFRTTEGYKIWEKSFHTWMEKTFTDTLGAGSWTRVQMVLPNTPPAEFGSLQVKIETHDASLK
jgi:hypothetical protein